MNNLAVKLSLFLLYGFSVACSSGERKDTPTYGEVAIAVDVSFRPLMEAQVNTFQQHYQYATVHERYLPEKEVYEALLQDSVKLIVGTRDLNAKERKYFEDIQLVPRVTRIATDAVAIILHPDNPDTLLTVDDLEDILSGRRKTWRTTGEKIHVVYDHEKSGNYRYIRERFGIKTLSDNVFAVTGNADVVDYVQEHEHALGILGVNWISDRDDTTAFAFLKRITVASIGDASGDYYQPYQAYMALKKYPLTRDVYIISREARTGLARGFSAFVAGDIGQRIVLKSGLLPATAPIRVVNLKK